MIRIIFQKGTRDERSIVGADAEEVLDKWNADPWWIALEGPEFAQRLVDLYGLDDPKIVREPIELPVEDEVLLDAVIEATEIQIEREGEGF